MEEEPPARRLGINAVLEAEEIDPRIMQLLNEIDQAPHCPTEPIELPDHERVTFAQMGPSLEKSWAIGARAARLVAEDPLTARTAQRVPLKINILLFR